MHHDQTLVAAPTPCLSQRYSGTADGVRDALAATKASISTFALLSEEVFAAELVLAEALNNVVEHALQNVNEPWFHLEVARHGRGLNVLITDPGSPMPDGHLPIGTRPALHSQPEDLPESGFGWFLIRELARDLDYRREEGLNTLRFRLAIGIGGE